MDTRPVPEYFANVALILVGHELPTTNQVNEASGNTSNVPGRRAVGKCENIAGKHRQPWACR